MNVAALSLAFTLAPTPRGTFPRYILSDSARAQSCSDTPQMPPANTETNVVDVITPNGFYIGCENPRYRMIYNQTNDPAFAKTFFDRLTPSAYWKEIDPAQLLNIPSGFPPHKIGNFVDLLRIRKDDDQPGKPKNKGIIAGYRKAVQCRNAIIWIFQWPDEKGLDATGRLVEKLKPVLLEFAGSASEPCTPDHDGDMIKDDADGGGP